MTTEIIVAVGAVIGAVLAAAVALYAHRMTRLANVERRMDDLEKRNRSLWRYCRLLIDHIYRGLGPPPPPWPDDLDKLDAQG